VLKRVWWTNTKVYQDLQPFCLSELNNKPTQNQSDHNFDVKIKGDVVVGCDAGVLLFFDLNAVQNNLAIVGGVPVGGIKEILFDKVKLNSQMRLPQ